MSFRAVLFDWGGTLVEGRQWAAGAPAAAVAAYARHNLHLALGDAVFDRAFGAVLPPHDPGREEAAPPIEKLIALAFAELSWTLDAEDVAECGRRFFKEATFADFLFSDARALLSSLKYRGYQLGVVTNSLFGEALFRPWLAEEGLAGCFDVFISSADVGFAKPHLAPFSAALSGLRVDPHEVLFVGDRVETDIAGARAAGMRAVLIDRTTRRREGAGYFVISHLGALNDLLGEGMAQ